MRKCFFESNRLESNLGIVDSLDYAFETIQVSLINTDLVSFCVVSSAATLQSLFYNTFELFVIT